MLTSQFSFTSQRRDDLLADPTFVLLEAKLRPQRMVGEVRKIEINHVHGIIRTRLYAVGPAYRSQTSRRSASSNAVSFPRKSSRMYRRSFPSRSRLVVLQRGNKSNRCRSCSECSRDDTLPNRRRGGGGCPHARRIDRGNGRTRGALYYIKEELPMGQPEWASPGFQGLLAQALDSALKLQEPGAEQFGDLLGVRLGGGGFHDLAG